MFNLSLKKNKEPARTCLRGACPTESFRRGFTLLEALVATSILMVAVAAPITIAQKGLSSAVYSKNQMIASYLAQDAIEYIKNKRDENFIKNVNNPTDWLYGLDPCVNNNSCQVDTVIGGGVGEVRAISDNPNGILAKNSNGFYGFDGIATNFKREINIVKEANVKALITVKVSWGADNDNVEVKTLIYNI